MDFMHYSWFCTHKMKNLQGIKWETIQWIGILKEVTYHTVIESPKFRESQNKLSSKGPTGIVETNSLPWPQLNLSDKNPKQKNTIYLREKDLTVRFPMVPFLINFTSLKCCSESQKHLPLYLTLLHPQSKLGIFHIIKYDIMRIEKYFCVCLTLHPQNHCLNFLLLQ